MNMPPLNMQSDVARDANQKMIDTHNCCTENWTLIHDAVFLGLRDGETWKGLSAQRFFESFSEVTAAFREQVDQMKELQERLYKEIVQWETLGGNLVGNTPTSTGGGTP
jgi:hypothetical protein